MTSRRILAYMYLYSYINIHVHIYVYVCIYNNRVHPLSHRHRISIYIYVYINTLKHHLKRNNRQSKMKLIEIRQKSGYLTSIAAKNKEDNFKYGSTFDVLHENKFDELVENPTMTFSNRTYLQYARTQMSLVFLSFSVLSASNIQNMIQIDFETSCVLINSVSSEIVISCNSFLSFLFFNPLPSHPPSKEDRRIEFSQLQDRCENDQIYYILVDICMYFMRDNQTTDVQRYAYLIIYK